MESEVNRTMGRIEGGVRIDQIAEDQASHPSIYDPSHPQADSRGLSMLRTWMSCKKWLISQRLLEHSSLRSKLKYRKTSYDSNNRNVTEIAIMSITGLENIRTMADVRADQNRPVGGEDLDRNAFLRLFTTQLQNRIR